MIGESTFYNCESLIQVKIPNSVTCIRSYAFYGCTSLTKLKIPPSLTSIGYNALLDCSSLTHLSVPSSLNISKSGITSKVEIERV
ncbi:hypothetical protein M9Y10_020017 [Tritrichomonas musculus]|uniref:Uncharacterized protein n=1 Tax=Tritrichomonas musculus TaxID=1915356 RepID=A0ABR2HF38_9EUKA